MAETETKINEAGAMSAEFLVPLLETLPAYAEITLRRHGGVVRNYDIRLMARDRPGPGRRFTNLTTGTEWMGITSAALTDLDVTSAIFHEFSTEVCG